MPMASTRVVGSLGAVVAVVMGCNPNTSRPAFLPLPAAATAELELPVVVAVDVIAEALRRDSIPVAIASNRDGYLESGWFLAQDGAPTERRPVGVEVVMVRGWVTPGRAGHTDIQVETVYRPLADPSRPGRELERLVPADHPVARRLEGALARLITEFGHPEALATRAAPVAVPDTSLTKPPPAKPDTTAKPDTIPRGPRRQVP